MARERDEIRRILTEIAALFGAVRGELASAVEVMATLDAAQARALFGELVHGRLAFPSPDGEMVLVGARHPLLDERLHALRVEIFGSAERRDPTRVVPLDFRLPPEAAPGRVGPNAGGKTVTLKTIGVMALMAAHGIPLPADAGTTIPAFEKLWCHIGDEQDVSADLSSFSGAMAATRTLLDSCGKGSLVLYDELGAGTDPMEGAALGLALLEELTRRGCVTVATTHLAAIALNTTEAEAMTNASMGYDEGRELPTYTLSFGRPGRSRAIEIARRTGIPEPILRRAGELLGGDHPSSTAGCDASRRSRPRSSASAGGSSGALPRSTASTGRRKPSSSGWARSNVASPDARTRSSTGCAAGPRTASTRR
jgi:DNA mismatch repair protein MutS2